MPKYDIECEKCSQQTEMYFSFEDYDKSRPSFSSYCNKCGPNTFRFFIKQAPGVEYRMDGVTKTDWADPHEKYKRDHFAESGDISDRKTLERQKRRSK